VVLRLAGARQWRPGKEMAVWGTHHKAHRSSGSGWATRVKWWRRWGSAGACFCVREEESGAVRGAESLPGGGGLL
jgi:hypothetical protein